MNGVTRPFCGWVSDHIGRENTLFIAFLLEGAGIWALWVYGHDPLLFVILGGIAFFAWGETASLFPTICTDTFGTKYATTNAAPPLHRQGHGLAADPAGQLLGRRNGELARRLPDRRPLQRPRRLPGAGRPEAVARDARAQQDLSSYGRGLDGPRSETTERTP